MTTMKMADNIATPPQVDNNRVSYVVDDHIDDSIVDIIVAVVVVVVFFFLVVVNLHPNDAIAATHAIAVLIAAPAAVLVIVRDLWWNGESMTMMQMQMQCRRVEEVGGG